MSLHIKTLQIRNDDSTLYADLQYANMDGDLGVRVRITRTKKRGGEKQLGFALVNKAGELIKRPEEVSEHERDLIERAIKEAVG